MFTGNDDANDGEKSECSKLFCLYCYSSTINTSIFSPYIKGKSETHSLTDDVSR